MSAKIAVIQTGLTNVVTNPPAIYHKYFMIELPATSLSIDHNEEVLTVPNFEETINVGETGMLNCVFNGEVKAVQGVDFFFTINGTQLQTNSKYGLISNNFEVLNYLQSGAVTPASYQIDLNYIANQESETENIEFEDALVQCYLVTPPS